MLSWMLTGRTEGDVLGSWPRIFAYVFQYYAVTHLDFLFLFCFFCKIATLALLFIELLPMIKAQIPGSKLHLKPPSCTLPQAWTQARETCHGFGVWRKKPVSSSSIFWGLQLCCLETTILGAFDEASKAYGIGGGYE